MSATPLGPDPKEIRDYLLRRLSDTARARFEEAYFADDGLFDRVESEEDRLVSDYVLGHLGQSDRVRFEESLLRSPYYQERVDTTNRIHRRLVRSPGGAQTRRPPEQPGPPQIAPRAAEPPLFPPGTGKAVVIVVLGILLVAALLSAIQLKRDVEALKAERGIGGNATPPAISAGLVPAATAVVLQTPAEPGPPLRRIRPIPGKPLLIVIPRSGIPMGASSVRISLIDQLGEGVFESEPVELSGSAAEGDLALRLPTGLPPRGFSALVVSRGRVTSLLAILEISEKTPSP